MLAIFVGTLVTLEHIKQTLSSCITTYLSSHPNIVSLLTNVFWGQTFFELIFVEAKCRTIDHSSPKDDQTNRNEKSKKPHLQHKQTEVR